MNRQHLNNNFLKTGVVHIILCLLIPFIALPYIGGPTSWDELLYLDLSIFPHQNPIVLFRYGHIYLQKLFISFFYNKIEGASYFWGVITISTFLQVIRLSYLLSKRNLFIGFISGFLFFSSNVIFQKYVGLTYPDFTIMFIGVSMLTLYYSGLNSKIKTILLTFLFVYALKTKETSLAFGFILIADWINYGIENIKKGIFNSVIGAGLSLLLFISLDFILLNDPLFSFDPENFTKRVSYDLAADYFKSRSGRDYLSFIMKGSMSFAIIFYLRYLFINPNTIKNKLVELIPLFYLGLLIISSIKGAWGIEDRYLIPVVPIICLYASLGVYTYFIDDYKTKKYQVKFFLTVLIGLLVATVLKKLAVPTLEKFNWNYYDFHLAIEFPLCVLFLFLIFSTETILNRRFLVVLAMIFTTSYYHSYDVLTNLIMLKNKDKLSVSDERFIPLKESGNLFLNGNDHKIYIDPSLFSDYRMLGRNSMSSFWMYRIFYKREISFDQIVYEKFDPSYLIDNQIDYYLLSDQTRVDLHHSNNLNKTNHKKFTLISRK